MQVPSLNTTTASQKPASATAQTNNNKKIKTASLAFMSDMINITGKKPAEQVAIGILTLGSAVAGFLSAKKILPKLINTIIMAAVGFAAGLGVTDAVNKYRKTAETKPVEDKKTETTEKDKTGEAPKTEQENNAPKTESSQETSKEEKDDDDKEKDKD